MMPVLSAQPTLACNTNTVWPLKGRNASFRVQKADVLYQTVWGTRFLFICICNFSEKRIDFTSKTAYNKATDLECA